MQSKMKQNNKEKNSICDTTTLMTISDKSFQEQQSPQKPRRHDFLLSKIEQLEGILMSALTDNKNLVSHHQILLQELEEKRNRVSMNTKLNSANKIGSVYDEDACQSFTDYFCQTPKEEVRLGKPKGKGHQKYYSAIQSPTIRRSPDRFQFSQEANYLSKQKHGYTQSVFSKPTGKIRKQCQPIKTLRRQNSEINFLSIEEIWNEGGKQTRCYHSKNQSVKSFL